MIIYNMRSRGPYEYDKFCLNIFQAANEAKRLRKKIENGEIKELSNEVQALNLLLDKLTATDSISMKNLFSDIKYK